MHIVVTAVKISNKALHYIIITVTVNTVSTSKWLHLIRISIEHPKTTLQNCLLTQPCTECQDEGIRRWQICGKAELTFLNLKSVACATQVSTAACDRVWIWPSSFTFYLSLIPTNILLHCNLWFKHACPLKGGFCATPWLWYIMSCSKRKGKFSHSKQYGHKVQTFAQLLHTTKILRTVCQCRKHFLTAAELADAGIHTSSGRCKHHLNSCSGPKQLARLSSQCRSMAH